MGKENKKLKKLDNLATGIRMQHPLDRDEFTRLHQQSPGAHVWTF